MKKSQRQWVSKRTIIRWSQDHESFGSALAQGKGVSDAKVIRSLYQRAVGYEYEEEKKIIEYDKDGNVKPIKIEKTRKQVPPDVVAQCFWLKNATAVKVITIRNSSHAWALARPIS